ncbi:MAG: alpha/beta hydrolase [Thermoanaerobaculia bacterium]
MGALILTHYGLRRIQTDAVDDLRSTQVSARFGRELLNAQAYVRENVRRWRQPLLAVIAGDDRLADSHESERLLGQVDERWRPRRGAGGGGRPLLRVPNAGRRGENPVV